MDESCSGRYLKAALRCPLFELLFFMRTVSRIVPSGTALWVETRYVDVMCEDGSVVVFSVYCMPRITREPVAQFEFLPYLNTFVSSFVVLQVSDGLAGQRRTSTTRFLRTKGIRARHLTSSRRCEGSGKNCLSRPTPRTPSSGHSAYGVDCGVHMMQVNCGEA